MCIIIAQPADTPDIPLGNLTQAAVRNSHGMGIAYVKDKKLVVYRSLTEMEKLVKHYRRARELKSPALIHFRVATKGEVHDRNCHPFFLDGDGTMVFAHNGTITLPGVDHTKDKGTKSDSLVFKDKVLKPMFANDPDFLASTHIRELLLKFIDHSKLVFLNNQGRLDIIGEDRGRWDGGVWYSNLSYLNPNQFFHAPFKKWLDDLKSSAAIEKEADPTVCSPFKILPKPLETSNETSSRNKQPTFDLLGKKEKEVENGFFYMGRTLCLSCIPNEAMGSNDLITLYNDFGQVLACDQCAKVLNDDTDF